MVAVSDASPVSGLALTGCLHLLRSQFTEVWIPDAVRSELERIPNLEAKASIEGAFQEGWLRCRAVRHPRLIAALASELDKGEAEAIALAAEMQADVVLLDEKEGRSLARRAGLQVRGVLGVLIRAKARGEISSVGAVIKALRSRAGFFIAPDLEAEVLRSVGE